MIKYFFLLLITISCGDPFSFFDDELKRHGYHVYSTPLENSGTGTLVSGSAKNMGIIAAPEACFPFLKNKPLRAREESTLPVRMEAMTVNADLRAKFLSEMASSSPSIRAGANINEVTEIKFEAKGIHIEYLDSMRVIEYYQTELKEICKEFLQGNTSFITQVIKVDRLEFVFYRKGKNRVYIDLDNVNQYLDFEADIKWKIEENYKLIIETPKYIAYQLGRLKEDRGHLTLYRTKSIGKEDWKFYEVVTIGAEEDISILSDYLKGVNHDNFNQ